MRLAVLAVLALAASAAPEAQTRFLAACVASAQEGAELPFDPEQVCGCATDGAIAKGVRGSDLDVLIDYVGEDQDFDTAAMPEAVQATAAIAVESLLGCALAGGLTPPGAEATSPAAEPQAGMIGRAAAGSSAPEMAVPAAPASLPSGLRTGNGTAPVRTDAAGPGTAIRIVG